MKSSTNEWLERTWAWIGEVAPYLVLLLLPGGSLLMLILVVSRNGRGATAASAIGDKAKSLTTLLFGKLPKHLYLGSHAPFFAYRGILGETANEPNHKYGTHLAAESSDMGH